MGRKRQGPSPSVPERNRQFARHLNRLLSDASLDPKELAALLGRTEVLIYKYLQGVHLPKLHDLPELAQALNHSVTLLLAEFLSHVLLKWIEPHSVRGSAASRLMINRNPTEPNSDASISAWESLCDLGNGLMPK